MYDKGEQEDLSEFKRTEPWEAVQITETSPEHSANRAVPEAQSRLDRCDAEDRAKPRAQLGDGETVEADLAVAGVQSKGASA
jgi:hypothetical protein